MTNVRYMWPDGLRRGWFDLDEAAYHNDLLDPFVPTLNNSTLKLFLQCPLLGWAAHPRLGGQPSAPSASLDMGSLAHSLVLGKGGDIVVVEAEDYRQKGARDARDEARKAGRTPVLKKDLIPVQSMVEEARSFLTRAGITEDTIRASKVETAMVWDLNGVWCRGKVDLALDRHVIIDYKTTIKRPDEEWVEAAGKYGYLEQAALYSLGYELIEGVAPKFVFLVQQKQEPWLCRYFQYSDEALVKAKTRILAAAERWAKCLASDTWPDYGTKPFLIGA